MSQGFLHKALVDCKLWSTIKIQKGEWLEKVEMENVFWAVMRSYESRCKGSVPTCCFGPSMLELLELFAFIMSEEGDKSICYIPTLRGIFHGNDDVPQCFLKLIEKEPLFLEALRRLTLGNKPNDEGEMIIYDVIPKHFRVKIL